MIAAASDEMQMLRPVIALQMAGHNCNLILTGKEKM
jgi:hypothetical protein